MPNTKTLRNLRQKLKKKFGTGSVVLQKELQALAYMPYGVGCQSIMVELAIGRPGFPAGRLVEIIGAEASAKSTLAYHILAECQRLGGIGILLETEESFETSRLKKLGINVDDLIICQPKHLEEAFKMMDINVREVRKVHDGPIVLVFDSVASTPPMAEVEGDYDDESMAVAARVISKSLRKFIRTVGELKLVLIFINQMKTNLDRYSGDKWISFGGRSIKFHSSLRFIVKTRKMDLELKGIEPSGMWISAYNIKNRLSTPYRTKKFFLNFKKGIDLYRDCREAGIAIGVFKEVGKGRLEYKGDVVDKTKLKKFIKKRWGTVYKCQQFLRTKAIKKGMLEPYGNKEEK
jgi:recombination protein RecA